MGQGGSAREGGVCDFYDRVKLPEQARGVPSDTNNTDNCL